MGLTVTETCARGNGTEVLVNKDKQGRGRTESWNNYLNTHATRVSLSKPPGSYVVTAAIIPQDKNPNELPIASTSASDHSVMHRNGRKLFFEAHEDDKTAISITEISKRGSTAQRPLTWDWTIEHEDRKRERKVDDAMHAPTPFEVDRKILKDVVREKMDVEVGRIRFLSAGTFHKVFAFHSEGAMQFSSLVDRFQAYLVTSSDHVEVVARVARRFMPRLKTESEVATISYLRNKTNVPVSQIYHYDSNPYNRLGGEFILMSKAPGIPLSQVYHGLPYGDLVKLMKNVAAIILPLFAHRFKAIGSLYFGPESSEFSTIIGSGTPTPKAIADRYSAFPFSPTLGVSGLVASPKTSSLSLSSLPQVPTEYHVGPIISWPFFGSNRGELKHPTELNRGPWTTTESYLASCVTREIDGVICENEGRSAPHRLHLDPDEIRSSRHHRLRAVPGDESDESEEWNLSESEDEWEGPGDVMYRDYRRMQRSTFLVAHMAEREQKVRKEMGRWMSMMERLGALLKKREGPEEFGLDCHDLSLENIFVDEKDNTTITAIIDWESTTTRPLWACAHVPAFLQSSPFLTKLFREVVSKLPTDPDVTINLPRRAPTSKQTELEDLCREWLYYEAFGTRLRMAHRCAEWDGWEEGLVDSILGPEEFEAEWFKHGTAMDPQSVRAVVSSPGGGADSNTYVASTAGRRWGGSMSGAGAGKSKMNGSTGGHGTLGVAGVRGAVKLSSKLPLLEEQEKEQMLNTTGDICGGRGGELGRRLEAWLTVSGNLQQVQHQHRDFPAIDVDVEPAR